MVFLSVVFASSTLFARVMIEDIHISKDIDKERYLPIDIVDEIPNDSKRLAVSARVRNLPHNKKIRVVWYEYNKKNRKVANAQSYIAPKDNNFLYHIVKFKNMIGIGRYYVDFLLDNKLLKTISFEVYESRSKYTLKWIKLNKKGVKLFNEKKYDEAIEVLKESIEVLKQDNPINYYNILLTLNNMAQTYISSKNYRASKLTIEVAEKIAKNHNLLNSLNFARTLAKKAEISLKESDYKKAIELYTKSLEISDKEPNISCKRYIIDIKKSLYSIYMRQKDYENARFAAQEVAECHNNDILSMLMVADTYIAQKNYKIAQKYLDRVYKKLKKYKKPNRYLVYKMMSSMSQLYIDTQRYKKAKIVTNKLIKKSKKIYGTKNQHTIDALEKLARIYRETGDKKREKIVEKNIIKLYTEMIESKSCSDITTKEDSFIYKIVYKKYSELNSDILSSYHFKRYIEKKHKISLISPLGWQSKDDDIYIIHLQHRDKNGNIDRYSLREIPRFWKNDKSLNYKKLIKKISNDMDSMLRKSAKSIGDTTTQTIPLKIFKRGKYAIGHTLIHQQGKIDRWYGNTFIFDGKNIYLLSTVSGAKNLLLGEFLSSLAVKSFCSDTAKSIANQH